MIEYKGYVGVFEFDEELGQFHGYVVNTQDVISFYGSSVEELKAELKTSVEEYLAFCAEKGRDPEKPFSGNLSIRTSPDIHRRIAMQAARRRVSMNSFVESLLEQAVSEG
jgi:predicted HicB family RNase H-like nuclease